MIHHSDHHKRNNILKDFGVFGYGMYWLLMEFIDEKGEVSLSAAKLRFDREYHQVLIDILDRSGEFHNQGNIYYAKTATRQFFTTETAKDEFSKGGLTGVVFSQMMTIHSVDEKTMMVEFEKWKEFNKANPFKDSKHLRNSFNYWLSKANLSKTTVKSGRNWDKI
jgi:hypothetical protein